MKYPRKENTLLAYPILAFYLLLVIRSAWISDDGMITFRVVENFLAGYGLGYNPFVRVQAFTHPLWMFLISIAYLAERVFVSSAPNALFHITIFLAFLFSGLTVYLLLTCISSPGILSGGFTLLTLSLSSSFIDFSTSGLENPLTHFLLIIFVIAYIAEAPNILLLAFISSLIMLNRTDAFLLIAPALLYVWWNSSRRKKDALIMLAGLMPILIWELFSLFYFGFLFPNTAYAKLNTGISGAALALQGFDYFLNSINWDPIVFFTIALAGITLYFEKNRKYFFLFTGVLLYLGYIIKIGGDFMSGRFLTAPLLLSTAIISNLPAEKKMKIGSLCLVVFLGVFSMRSPLWSSNMVLYLPTYPISDRNGVSDQRLHYFGNERKGQFDSFAENGFRNNETGSRFAGSEWRFKKFEKVYVADALGKPGYVKGPNTYVIDNYALSDPLLARLPTLPGWEIGHFRRELPEGYLETLETGENKIADPNLALYYSELKYVISGELFNRDRLIKIWKFNTGQYDHLLGIYKQSISR
jgi:arabinofuranosyltransferase